MNAERLFAIMKHKALYNRHVVNTMRIALKFSNMIINYSIISVAIHNSENESIFTMSPPHTVLGIIFKYVWPIYSYVISLLIRLGFLVGAQKCIISYRHNSSSYVIVIPVKEMHMYLQYVQKYQDAPCTSNLALISAYLVQPGTDSSTPYAENVTATIESYLGPSSDCHGLFLSTKESMMPILKRSQDNFTDSPVLVMTYFYKNTIHKKLLTVDHMTELRLV